MGSFWLAARELSLCLFNGFQDLVGILLISSESFGILSLAIKRSVSLLDAIDHGLVKNPSFVDGENYG